MKRDVSLTCQMINISVTVDATWIGHFGMCIVAPCIGF